MSYDSSLQLLLGPNLTRQYALLVTRMGYGGMQCVLGWAQVYMRLHWERALRTALTWTVLTKFWLDERHAKKCYKTLLSKSFKLFRVTG